MKKIVHIVAATLLAIRWPLRFAGIASLYCICSLALELTTTSNSLIDTNNIVEREVSPDRSWVALVCHRYRLNNLFFKTTITDAVFVVRSQEEKQFITTLQQRHCENNGVVIRHSRTNHLEHRPLIHWLFAGQLDVTAPINTDSSYIVLSGQTYDGLTITFSFEESPEMQQRRHNLTGTRLLF
jgi:hypothetical protein